MQGLYCDLIEFENTKLEKTFLSKNNINKLEQICSLYIDDLFLKKNYEWCESEKEYFQRNYINMLKNIALFYIEEGLYKNAMDKLMIIKKKSPFDEKIHQLILRIHGIQKNRTLLIQSHEEFKVKLFEVMGVKPQEETDRLFISLLNGL